MGEYGLAILQVGLHFMLPRGRNCVFF
jgi:hypothetical protein